jgi:hypothetical protein
VTTTTKKSNWAFMGFAEAAKLKAARALANRRKKAADYADPIYRDAERQRQRESYHRRKGAATLNPPPAP